MNEETMSPALFSVTFKLRKKQEFFSELLSTVALFHENGYHLLFSTDGGRWLKIDCFEKAQQHPTITIRRMLAKEPNSIEKMEISALNFAIFRNSQLTFSIDPDIPEFTVTVRKPARNLDYEQICNNCKLLGVKIQGD